MKWNVNFRFLLSTIIYVKHLHKKISFIFLMLFLSLRARVTSKIFLQSDFSCWNCLHRSFLFIMTTLVISDNLPLLYFLNFDRNESIYHLQDLFWLLLLVSSRLFTKSENKDKASLIVFHLHWHSAKFQLPPTMVFVNVKCFI